MTDNSPLEPSQEQRIMQRERGGCLTTWLVLIGIANGWYFIFDLFSINMLNLFGLFNMVSGVIALVGVVYIWHLKKWGYYILMACYLFALLLSLQSTEALASSLVGSIIGMGILSLLVLNKWEAFE